MKKTEREIIGIIQKALDVDMPVTIDSSVNSIADWDSLRQINIIVALDEAMGGAVSELQEMATAGSVRQMLDILRANGLVADG